MTIVKALYVAIAVRTRRPPETVVATVLALAFLVLAPTAIASDRLDDGQREQWVGTWGTHCTSRTSASPD